MINNAVLRTIIQLIPMECFLIAYNIVHDWYYAFLAGGITALLLMGIFLAKKTATERFILAIYLFLIVGMIGLWFEIPLIEQLYEQCAQTTLFIWLCVVGLVTTVATKNGFINVAHTERSKVIIYSLYLLAATVVATLFSYTMRGSLFLSGALPFVFLRIVQTLLEKQMRQSRE